jgi:hypothetical protein
MSHSVSRLALLHEAKLRLIKLERKIESKKLGQLKTKLQTTSDAKQPVLRFGTDTWADVT